MDGRSKINRLKFSQKGNAAISIIWGFVFLFLTVCIIFPLICVLFTPTVQDLKAVAASSIWKTAALNTLAECICSTLLSVLIGFLYAYGIVKVRIPFSKFFSVVPLIHLITPPFVGGLSFILLLGKQGFITHKLLGLDISLYGFWGLLIAQSLCFFPIAYMMCSETLKGINPSLERAAKGLGAGRLKIFFTVTLPLSMPGIAAALLYIAVSVMSDFGNPMIVAGRFRVLAVEIYTQLTGWINGGKSAILGILLVIPSVILFTLQNKLTRKNMARTATISGHGQNLDSENSSKASKIFFTIFCSFISLCVLAQFLAIIAGSFQKLWGINTSFTWDHIKTLSRCSLELKNTLTFALEGAILSTILATAGSYLVYRTKCPFKPYIDTLSQLPAAIPGTLFGLAFSLAAAKLNFHNSKVLIVIAITVGFLPFSYKSIAAAFSQIKTSLDDGATSLGAGPVKVLSSILVPIAKGSIFNSFVYDFARGVGTMSAVIFLVSFKTPLTSIKILNLAEQGFWGDAAALAMLLTIVTFGLMGIGKLIMKIWSLKYGK